MAYTLCPYEQRQYEDDNGAPLAFGKVYTYLSGTSTPVFTFSDSTGTLNTNPVVLSASGRARIYLDPLLSYKFIVTDANDVPVGLTMDPVSLNGSTFIANLFQAATLGAVGAPAFSFVNDSNTGIYSSAANTLDVSTNGVNRLRFFPGGGMGAEDGSITVPSYSFVNDPDTGMYSGGANLLAFTTGGVQRLSITPNAGAILVNIAGGAFGAGGVPGSQLRIGNNTSGGGAAGALWLEGKGGADNFIWADASSAPGQLRISTAAPEEDGTPSDTSGTVVGTQASSRDTKDVIGAGIAPDDALAIILHTPIARFTYKGGSYSGTIFHGIIAEDSPEFAMDPDAAHPHGRSFNPVSAFGYTVQAFKAMQAQIDTLTAEVHRLKGTNASS